MILQRYKKWREKFSWKYDNLNEIKNSNNIIINEITEIMKDNSIYNKFRNIIDIY